MNVAEMKLFIKHQIELMDEQQLTRLYEFMKDIENLKDINPIVISNAHSNNE